MTQPGETAQRLLDRLSRRGKVTIAAEDGSIEVRLEAHGPWVGGSCTSEKHDLFLHCRLGAKDWTGEGSDLAALLLTCEMESRPDSHNIDDLVWSIERRRNSRTYGPPLPSYRRWDGWRPGEGRWLEVSDHKYEYLAGYVRYGLIEESRFEAERQTSRRLVASANGGRCRPIDDGIQVLCATHDGEPWPCQSDSATGGEE